MKVTEKDVLYVADLANLELTEQERQRMLKDLNSILEHIDMLGQLDMTRFSDSLHANLFRPCCDWPGLLPDTEY